MIGQASTQLIKQDSSIDQVTPAGGWLCDGFNPAGLQPGGAIDRITDAAASHSREKFSQKLLATVNATEDLVVALTILVKAARVHQT